MLFMSVLKARTSTHTSNHTLGKLASAQPGGTDVRLREFWKEKDVVYQYNLFSMLVRA